MQEIFDSHDNSLDYTADYEYDLVGNRLQKTVDQGSDASIDETYAYTYDNNDPEFFLAELVRRASEKLGVLFDRVNVTLDRVFREIPQLEVLDHSLSQRCHVWLLSS